MQLFGIFLLTQKTNIFNQHLVVAGESKNIRSEYTLSLSLLFSCTATRTTYCVNYCIQSPVYLTVAVAVAAGVIR